MAAVRCFDSDDEGAATAAAPGPANISSGNAAPGAGTRLGSAKPPQGPERPPALYSDDEADDGAKAPPPKPAIPVPQFRRTEWQPPPSQLPIGSSSSSGVAAQPPPPQNVASAVVQQPQQQPWSPPVSLPFASAGAPPSSWQQQAQQQVTAVAQGHQVPPPSLQPQVALTFQPPLPWVGGGGPSSSTSFEQQQQQPQGRNSFGQPSSVGNSPANIVPHGQQAMTAAVLNSHPIATASQVVVSAASAACPPPFVAPALPQSSRPPSMAPAAPPVQRPIPLENIPPAPNAIPQSNLAAHMAAASSAESSSSSWDAFQNLRRELEDAHKRTLSLHEQMSQLQLTHEKEAATFRDAANAQIELQRKALETTTEHCNDAQAKIENMTALLNRKAEYIVKLEQQLHEANVSMASSAQKLVHMEDRVKLSDSARQVAEVRTRELDLTLAHSAQLVQTLRSQLSSSHADKVQAMQQQFDLFDHNRQELIAFYHSREQQVIQNFNASIEQLQQMMEDRMAQREAAVARHWEDVIAEIRRQYERLQKDVNVIREDSAKEVSVAREKILQEREQLEEKQRKELQLMEQRHREHEDHVLQDISRRERELAEREQKWRVQRAQDEQDAKVALLTKEAEMKAYYEKMVEDLRRAHEQDRDKLCASFRDQLQQLSSQHLNSERELERLHREKEREMAQRYRVAGYEVDDRKGQVDLQDVTLKTQSSLLSKFETIEGRQRERAELSRAAMRSSTSLSGIGLSAASVASPPQAASSDAAAATSGSASTVSPPQ